MVKNPLAHAGVVGSVTGPGTSPTGALDAQSCLTLCHCMDCSPPGSSVRGVLQARILEWVAISYSGNLSDPGIEPLSLMSPALAGRFFTPSATWEALPNIVR